MLIGGHDNPFADVTPTSSSEQTGYESDRLQDPRIWYRTRTADGTFTFTLTYDLGSSLSVRFLVGLGHNLGDDATLRIEASDTSDFSVLITDTGTNDALDFSRSRPVETRPPEGVPILHVFDAPVTARYWRITLDDVSRSSGWVELGHVVGGAVLDLHVARGPILSRGTSRVRGIREWQLGARLSSADADNLGVLYEWSRNTQGRLLIISDPETPAEWQHRVLWTVAVGDRFDQAWLPNAVNWVDVRMTVREVDW